jgi:hypothetical protein
VVEAVMADPPEINGERQWRRQAMVPPTYVYRIAHDDGRGVQLRFNP